MSGDEDFLAAILSRVARRYERKGLLSGTMKVGQSLSSKELSLLHNFFGMAPIRENAKEEVRISFDSLEKNEQATSWPEKIGSYLGYALQPVQKTHVDELAEILLARLLLAYPELQRLVSHLTEHSANLERLLVRGTVAEVTTNYFQAAATVLFLLHNTTPVTISELGARFFADSKALRQGELRALLLQWLQFYSPDYDILEDEANIWTNYHVLNDRLTVNALLYGPVVYTKNGKYFDWIYQLYEQGEAATIGWSNLQDIEQIYWLNAGTQPPDLICCENEAPYSQLLRQEPKNALLFTSGFPGSGVRKIYELLAPQAGTCYHWGDSDPAGLRIAAIMHSIHPLQLYRCDISTLRGHKPFLLPLSPKQKTSAKDILCNHPDFPYAQELRFTLENGWLEQESWRTMSETKAISL